ncbi:MAG: putative Ig domain-containing protein, partial [Coriobacteriales bacterium]|nr:putative Ig domain-containing protein [Coriobacteriales bacterium]
MKSALSCLTASLLSLLLCISMLPAVGWAEDLETEAEASRIGESGNEADSNGDNDNASGVDTYNEAAQTDGVDTFNNVDAANDTEEIENYGLPGALAPDLVSEEDSQADEIISGLTTLDAAPSLPKGAVRRISELYGKYININQYRNSAAGIADSITYARDSTGNIYVIHSYGSTFSVYKYNTELNYIGTVMQDVSRNGFEYWGGSYQAPDGTIYLALAKSNDDEDDDANVIEIVRFDSNWNETGYSYIKGGVNHSRKGIYLPMAVGRSGMVVVGNQLFIHAGRHMYDIDGVNHQSNIQLVVDISAVSGQLPSSSFQDKFGSNKIFYESHSFNQFILTDGTTLYMLSHGDAYERQIRLGKSTLSASGPGAVSESTLMNITPPYATVQDNYVYNYTGVTLTAAVLTDTHLLAVGGSVPHDNPVPGYASAPKVDIGTEGQPAKYSMVRNIYVLTYDKATNTNGFNWLTTYDPQSTTVKVYEPRLIQLSGSQSVLLFTVKDGDTYKTEYRLLNASGQVVASKTYNNMFFTPISDPIVVNGYITWVSSNAMNTTSEGNSERYFYQIPALIENIAPTATIQPANGTGNVLPSGELTLTFNEPMDTTSAGVVALSSGSVTNSYWIDGYTCVVQYADIPFSTAVNVAVSGYKDISGNLQTPLSSSFTTLPAPTIPPVINTVSLPDGNYNDAYSQTLAYSGQQPIAWSIAKGSLPTGLSLNSATGIISGTPMTIGTFTFTVQATNLVGSNQKEYSLTINLDPGEPALVLTPNVLYGTRGKYT